MLAEVFAKVALKKKMWGVKEKFDPFYSSCPVASQAKLTWEAAAGSRLLPLESEFDRIRIG
jgi:hypothetical protein